MSRGRPTIDEKFLHTYSQPPLLGPHKLTLLSADLDTSPALTNVSTKQTKTKNLHQVFYQFSNFSDNLCGGAEGSRGGRITWSRGEPLSAPSLAAEDPSLSRRCSWEVPAQKAHFVSETFRPHPSPSGAPFSSPRLIRVFFKVKTFPFLRGILVPTVNETTLRLVMRAAPVLILGPLSLPE